MTANEMRKLYDLAAMTSDKSVVFEVTIVEDEPDHNCIGAACGLCLCRELDAVEKALGIRQHVEVEPEPCEPPLTSSELRAVRAALVELRAAGVVS
jgi:hypothetical protein